MKVFVTVGSMLPFDRLVSAVAAWAAAQGETMVFAQVGADGRVPAGLDAQAMLTPAAFRQRLAWADVVVSHAGMGTVIEVLAAGTPLVVMPRDAVAGEATSDHQQATVRWLREQPGIVVAEDAQALPAAIATAITLASSWTLAPAAATGPRQAARAQLVDALRRFIQGA